MFRWAINKAFDGHPNVVTSMGELKFIIEDVWNDMVKDGEIHLRDDA